MVDLGCGTGLSFPYIIERIGPEGHLTGVDMTPGMLTCARERCERAGWHNVELVQLEIASYDFPQEIDAVISTGVMGYISEYGRVIQNAAKGFSPRRPSGHPRRQTTGRLAAVAVQTIIQDQKTAGAGY